MVLVRLLVGRMLSSSSSRRQCWVVARERTRRSLKRPAVWCVVDGGGVVGGLVGEKDWWVCMEWWVGGLVGGCGSVASCINGACMTVCVCIQHAVVVLTQKKNNTP